jgi:dynein heavy chain 1
LKELLVIKCFRPDRLLSGFGRYINALLQVDLSNLGQLDFNQFIQRNDKAPILFYALPGNDPSYKIESEQHSMLSIALGSHESEKEADALLKTAISKNQWLLLKNMHLAKEFSMTLESKLPHMNFQKGFRLLMTMEIKPEHPSALVQSCAAVMVENPPGIKSKLLKHLALCASVERQGPIEQNKLLFLLSWLHAVIVERVRYVPVGWSKAYEFGDLEFELALEMTLEWINKVAQQKSHLDPMLMPWHAMVCMLKDTIYGGKIDNPYDQQILDTLVDGIFNARAFESRYALVRSASSDETAVTVPEGYTFDAYLAWAHALPDLQPPSWIGLPDDIEKVIMEQKGNRILSQINLFSEHILLPTAGLTEVSESEDAIVQTIQNWMEELPEVTQLYFELYFTMILI